jgi:hypothetical protein
MTGGAVDLPTAAEMPAKLERPEMLGVFELVDLGRPRCLEKPSDFVELGVPARCSRCA